MNEVSVVPPAAVLALLALLLALGAVAFAAHAVGDLADKYTGFVQTHINGLRGELNQRQKEQTLAMEALAKDMRAGLRAAAQNDRELVELKKGVALLTTRLAEMEAVEAARAPSPRLSRGPALRSVKS